MTRYPLPSRLPRTARTDASAAGISPRQPRGSPARDVRLAPGSPPARVLADILDEAAWAMVEHVIKEHSHDYRPGIVKAI